MKKYLFLLALLNPLISANETNTLDQINATKSQIEELQKKLAKLESSLKNSASQDKDLEFQKKKKENELKTHTEFGFISSKGNTDTTTYNLDAKLNKRFDKHLFEVIFDGQYADDTNVETVNKYYSELLYSYDLSDRLAFEYLLGFKQDKFSSYDYQFYSGPGVKYKFIKTKKHTLSMASNILYSKDRESDILYDASGNVINYPNALNTPIASRTDGQTQNYTSYRAKFDYKWQILPSLKFTQEATYRTEFERVHNYFIYSKTGLISKLTDMLSAGLSYKVDYVNIPAEGTRNSDRTLSANIIVDY